MNGLKTAPSIGPRRVVLVAARRAAYAELVTRATGIGATCTGSTIEQYDGRAIIQVAGFDIGPAIDAAVLEALIVAGNPDPVPECPRCAAQKRPWWRLW